MLYVVFIKVHVSPCTLIVAFPIYDILSSFIFAILRIPITMPNNAAHISHPSNRHIVLSSNHSDLATSVQHVLCPPCLIPKIRSGCKRTMQHPRLADSRINILYMNLKGVVQSHTLTYIYIYIDRSHPNIQLIFSALPHCGRCTFVREWLVNTINLNRVTEFGYKYTQQQQPRWLNQLNMCVFNVC